MVLENEFLIAQINPFGAELKSLVRKDSNEELMWSGDPVFWGKTSPVLFPFVGSLNQNTYQFNNKNFPMGRHGFAREKEFEAVQHNNCSGEFIFKSSEDTFEIYPFHFELKISYTLENETLTCCYQVENTADFPMYFSLGAHPAFAAGTDSEDYHKYKLQFPSDELLELYLLEAGLISKYTSPLQLKDKTLAVSYQLFENDALVLSNLNSDKIILAHTEKTNYLEFHFEGFPYFGIWAAKNANFICLEPWCGVADEVDFVGTLEEKRGIERLQPKEKWLRSWAVSAK